MITGIMSNIFLEPQMNTDEHRLSVYICVSSMEHMSFEYLIYSEIHKILILSGFAGYLEKYFFYVLQLIHRYDRMVLDCE